MNKKTTNNKNFTPLRLGDKTSLNNTIKTMKKILFIFCLCTSLMSQAQISPKVMQSFPAHIIYKIDEVASKIKLTEDQQIKIGNRLVKRDSIANALIRKGTAVTNLKSYYTIYTSFLKPILSQEELEDYSYQIDKNNRFLLALKSAKELQLDSKQIEQIRIQNKLLDTIPQKNAKQQMIFYTRKLDSILKKTQYGSLLKILYSKESLLKTQKDWSNILKLKLATPKDSSATCVQIYNYNLIKNIMLDPKAGIYDTKKISVLKDKINLQYQPKIITRYNIASDEYYKKNVFSEAIKHEKELSLTGIQIDSLLSNYKKIELLKFNNKTQNLVPDKSNSYVSIENNAIIKILDDKQLSLLLIIKNKKIALATAKNDWIALEKKGLTKDLDKGSTVKEFTNYQLNYLVANDRVKMNKNQINLFYRRDVLLKKPALLKQLDEIKQDEQNIKSTKNELRW